MRSYIQVQVLLKFSGLISKCLWQRPITVLINNHLVNISSFTDRRRVKTILNWCIIYHFPMPIWALEPRLTSKCGDFPICRRGLIMINSIDQITTLFNKTVTHFNWFILITLWLTSLSLGNYAIRLTGQIQSVMYLADCLMSIRMKLCLNHYNGTHQTVKNTNTWHSRLNLLWDAIKVRIGISLSFSNKTTVDLISSQILRFRVCADLVFSLSSINL